MVFAGVEVEVVVKLLLLSRPRCRGVEVAESVRILGLWPPLVMGVGLLVVVARIALIGVSRELCRLCGLHRR